VETSKVTGMLLEMDNEELLMMLDNEPLMNAKVCVRVLCFHFLFLFISQVNEALSVYRQNK
jgi:hypothetical protein